MTEINVKASKDKSTVTSSGVRLEKLIDGVVLRHAPTHIDERGEISEVFSSNWHFDDTPVEYVYQAMIRPGRVKGWSTTSCRRIGSSSSRDSPNTCSGMRKDSPTSGIVDEIFLSERNRGLLLIPPYVVHAVQNIGLIDAVFVNMPTRPYDHADPDKYRVDPDSVPYSFAKGAGW